MQRHVGLGRAQALEGLVGRGTHPPGVDLAPHVEPVGRGAPGEDHLGMARGEQGNRGVLQGVILAHTLAQEDLFGDVVELAHTHLTLNSSKPERFTAAL